MNCAEIKALADGSPVDAFLQVRSKSYRVVSSGRGDMLVGELGDGSGTIRFVVFGGATINCKELDKAVEVGSVIQLKGAKNVHEGSPQIVVSSRDGGTIRVASPGEFDMSAFTPKTERSVDTMWIYITSLLDSVRNPPLKALLASFRGDAEFVAKFKQQFAARTSHHTWVGGLLEHTWEVMQHCEVACSIHTTLEKELLYTGAFLHDVGVLAENAGPMGMAEGREGFMVGHVYLSADAVSRKISGISGFPDVTRLKLLNIILSHHSVLEEGPGVQPRTPEAVVVAYADALGSRVSQFVKAKADSAGGDWKALRPTAGWVYTE